ncbi:hypothetical protein AMECASPLE_028428 [Ameca splendens]|uniref:Uncharacterized protein n=1 Tax=Ameca splendens TaxID=208324 RepID=A0ABV0YSK6_9TELE
MPLRVLPNDVNQDPELDEPAHHSHPPVLHQHLARGLVLKEEVRQGTGDLVPHLLSSADPQTGGSLLSPQSHIKQAEKESPSVSVSTPAPGLLRRSSAFFPNV